MEKKEDHIKRNKTYSMKMNESRLPKKNECRHHEQIRTLAVGSMYSHGRRRLWWRAVDDSLDEATINKIRAHRLWQYRNQRTVADSSGSSVLEVDSSASTMTRIGLVGVTMAEIGETIGRTSTLAFYWV